MEGKYRLVEQLGVGAMGEVFLARDEKLQRPVAIKFVHAELAAEAGDRLLVEARAMARVRHENVVGVYAFGDADGLPYFVMEFIRGVNLYTWVGQHAPLSVDEALGIIEPICAGVQAIHDADAVHHDLKPGNVFVGPGFRIAVGDLGLARLLTAPGDHHALGGTPFYMAPELMEDRLLDAQGARLADIYALGAMAFELLAGVVPFDGDDAWEILAQHRDKPPPKPSQLRRGLPPQLDPPILAALAKDPSARPASAAQLADALRRARPRSMWPRGPVRILVADDDEDFRMLAQAVLEEGLPGACVECVPDGTKALAALEREPAAVAVVDLQMPGTSGIELVAALQRSPRLRKVRTVIATAAGGAAEWRKLSQLGAGAFLPKPVDPGQLLDAVTRLLGRVEGPPSTP